MVDHDMHLVLHVLEDYAYRLDENQALDLSQSELFSRESLFSMEELDDLTIVGSTNDEKDAAICWVYEYCREPIHSFTPHTSISAIMW